jgi:hypothetical protein
LDAVRRSLHYEVEKSVAAIFHLLSCLYSRSFIDDARECIAYGPADKRAYALEALEQCLPKSAGRWLMALFEPASAEERRLRLTRYFPNPSLPSDERLMDILTRNDRVGSWTAAVTLFALLKLKVSIAVDKVALASRFDSAAVHEVLSKMGEPAARHSAGGGSLR